MPPKVYPRPPAWDPYTPLTLACELARLEAVRCTTPAEWAHLRPLLEAYASREWAHAAHDPDAARRASHAAAELARLDEAIGAPAAAPSSAPAPHRPPIGRPRGKSRNSGTAAVPPNGLEGRKLFSS